MIDLPVAGFFGSGVFTGMVVGGTVGGAFTLVEVVVAAAWVAAALVPVDELLLLPQPATATALRTAPTSAHRDICICISISSFSDDTAPEGRPRHDSRSRGNSYPKTNLKSS